MTIIEQLRQTIESYTGPLTGNSIEAVWFRQAAKQLLEMERQLAR